MGRSAGGFVTTFWGFVSLVVTRFGVLAEVEMKPLRLLVEMEFREPTPVQSIAATPERGPQSEGPVNSDLERPWSPPPFLLLCWQTADVSSRALKNADGCEKADVCFSLADWTATWPQWAARSARESKAPGTGSCASRGHRLCCGGRSLGLEPEGPRALLRACRRRGCSGEERGDLVCASWGCVRTPSFGPLLPSPAACRVEPRPARDPCCRSSPPSLRPHLTSAWCPFAPPAPSPDAPPPPPRASGPLLSLRGL